MVIDFHTHIFPEKIAARTIELLEQKGGIPSFSDGTLEGLLSAMERAGVNLSVVLPVATKPGQFESIKNFAKEVNERYPGKLLSFGGIHPDSPDYKRELKELRDAGFIGIKIHPDYQGVMIDDIRFMRIIEYAGELGLIVLTHAGFDVGYPDLVHCPPERMRKVLDEVKPEKMVLAHYGGLDRWDEVYDFLAGENVWLDTAFIFNRITEEQFLKIFRKHDPKKILFASDSPWSGMATAREWIEGLPLTEQEKEDIFFRNAKGLLGI